MYALFATATNEVEIAGNTDEWLKVACHLDAGAGTIVTDRKNRKNQRGRSGLFVADIKDVWHDFVLRASRKASIRHFTIEVGQEGLSILTSKRPLFPTG